MRKLIDKIGWSKAALCVGGTVAYVGWAGHNICTRGWAGVAEVVSVSIVFAGIAASAKFADDLFNPKPPASSPGTSDHSTRHERN